MRFSGEQEVEKKPQELIALFRFEVLDKLYGITDQSPKGIELGRILDAVNDIHSGFVTYYSSHKV